LFKNFASIASSSSEEITTFGSEEITPFGSEEKSVRGECLICLENSVFSL
jgi:hypothetical protein